MKRISMMTALLLMAVATCRQQYQHTHHKRVAQPFHADKGTIK
jgi:hypothetical protein